MTVHSPIHPPHLHRRRRRDAARRRAQQRRRRAAAGAAVGFIAVLVIGYLALASGRGEGLRGSRLAAQARKPVVHLSQMGLPLGRPALSLDLSSPQRDALAQMYFRHPPRAGLLFNLQTGQVLWQLNPTEPLRIASLTKMMTAWLVVHSAPPDAHALITRAAVESAGSKVGVLPLGGEVLVETLMYGLMLPSGNDAAVALAQHVAGTEARFVRQMNLEAARLGLGCTRYSSPSGYFNGGNYSCAADLAVLAHDDMLQPRIARIVRHLSASLPLPVPGGRVYLYNNNPLLIYHYPGITGLKTGFTDAAGKCLVATADRDGVQLGVVLLHSPYPGTQASRLLDAGFALYHVPPVREPPIPPGA